MWAVYLCGCTDCFLHALFMSEKEANEWALAKSTNPEGFIVKFFPKPESIDRSDTGWE